MVGAGPAGLEAARVCAERGHEVGVLEAAERPGGQVLLATRASWRRDLAGVVDWRVAELERLGATLRTGVFAESEDVLDLEPDLVIIATGGVPQLDWLDGAEHCDSAWDVLSGTGRGGNEVLVYDGTGRHAASTAAERLLMQGARVTLAAIDGSFCEEMTYAERAIWKRRHYELKLKTLFDRRLEKVERDGNRLRATLVNDLTEEAETLTVDQVVIEHGTTPADELYEDLRGQSCNDGVTDLDALLNGQPQPRERKRLRAAPGRRRHLQPQHPHGGPGFAAAVHDLLTRYAPLLPPPGEGQRGEGGAASKITAFAGVARSCRTSDHASAGEVFSRCFVQPQQRLVHLVVVLTQRRPEVLDSPGRA